MRIISKDELVLEASRGFVKNYYSSMTPVGDLEKPNFDTAISVFRNEPVVNAALKSIADEIVKNGFAIKSDNKKLKKTIEKELIKKYRFSRLLRQLVYNLVIYGNAFLEIVYKGDTPEELHVLETTEMEIVIDEHGEVQAYIQKHQEKSVTFNVDECIHISVDNINTSPWGEVDVKGLYKTVAAKQFLEKFIRELFQFNKFRDSWKLGNASEDQIKHFVSNIQYGREFTDKEFIIEGDDIERIPGKGFDNLNNLVDLLDYYRQQILTHLRVPPIIAGIPDNANRSNSEVQARRSFFTRIKALQNVIEEELTSELFPKMKWDTASFEFPPLDKTVEKDDIEIITALKEIGIDDESLLQYIKDVGIQLRPEAKIEKPEPMMGMGGSPFDKNNKKEDKNGPVKHETGERSTTRPDQLEGRSMSFTIGPEDLEDDE